jgi:hypothetical protein
VAPSIGAIVPLDRRARDSIAFVHPKGSESKTALTQDSGGMRFLEPPSDFLRSVMLDAALSVDSVNVGRWQTDRRFLRSLKHELVCILRYP